MRDSSPLFCIGLLTAILTAGCITSARNATPLTSAGRVISAATIERSGATNAWEVLRKVGTHMSFREDARGNPTSLTYRGHSSVRLSPEPLLVVDGAFIERFDYLRDIPAISIETLQILDGTEGTRYFGTGGGNGAIVVSTKVKE